MLAFAHIWIMVIRRLARYYSLTIINTMNSGFGISLAGNSPETYPKPFSFDTYSFRSLLLSVISQNTNFVPVICLH